jgi:hypothetical protein
VKSAVSRLVLPPRHLASETPSIYSPKLGRAHLSSRAGLNGSAHIIAYHERRSSEIAKIGASLSLADADQGLPKLILCFAHHSGMTTGLSSDVPPPTSRVGGAAELHPDLGPPIITDIFQLRTVQKFGMQVSRGRERQSVENLAVADMTQRRGVDVLADQTPHAFLAIVVKH